MRKVLIVLSLMAGANLLLIGLYSCNKSEPDPYPCNTTQQYKCGTLDSLSWKPYKTNYQSISANQAVRAEELVFEVTLLGNDVVCYKQSKPNPFISSAYACTPPLPIYNIKDSIEGISITSNHDFDATHPAGASLNEYFKMPDFKEFNALVANGGYGAVYDAEKALQLRLEQSPSDTGTHVFTLTLKHKSGNVKATSSVPIKLLL
ncbi:MAG TPA: DUF5034 domain-containing protein [Flavipsychrobacter sp.]